MKPGNVVILSGAKDLAEWRHQHRTHPRVRWLMSFSEILRSAQDDNAGVERMSNTLSGYNSLKAVETLLPVHEAQAISYLKESGHKLGLLTNFNVPVLKTDIKRILLS
jgi:FMN phosphatase YigB (HAD superfamily)